MSLQRLCLYLTQLVSAKCFLASVVNTEIKASKSFRVDRKSPSLYLSLPHTELGLISVSVEADLNLC